MRGMLLAIWVLVPVFAGAYHYGPGQERLKLDAAQGALSSARAAVAAGQHAQAVKLFSRALEELPPERVQAARRIQVERAKSQLLAKQLPAAFDELALLVPELQADASTDPALLAEARETLANARYYLTWLMRLEGEPRSEWEPEIEASRQTFRLLAEEATDPAVRERHQKDLESAIRLARMDLSELQALPLPSQCKGCCSGECQCKGGKGKGKKPGISQNKPRSDEFARGASSGPPPDDGGH
ncbi:MAG: hypothetical protein KF774_03430 [Planctomyces sp.]|nr:hypothetical protein [Planctomyces sp.]